jgi:pimeloyl-ACP methyl ester carboxylesterase
MTTTLFSNLAGDLTGEPDRRPPLVLLHGLTFDRTSWHPVLAELATLDPGRQVLALDLPGHGGSPPWPDYDLEPIADAVHRAVADAGLSAPVLAGHSAGGVIATIYAARYPAAGVVNVDQPLQVEPFARLVRLSQGTQDLLQSARYARQDLVTGYWREVLDEPPGELARKTADGLAAVRDAKVPYLFVAGHDQGREYLSWLTEALPQAEVTVWPGSGHFPHLAQPGRFGELLAATARWA